MTFALSFQSGYYDLASQVDFILTETKREKINYIGFSQGKSVCTPYSVHRAKKNARNFLQFLNFISIFRNDSILYFEFNAAGI